MNLRSVSSAALASSCDGGDEGEDMLLGLLPMLGLMVNGGAMEKGLLLLVLGVGCVVLGLDWCMAVSIPSADMSIGSREDSTFVDGSWGAFWDVEELGDPAPTSGTVWRRFKDAGANFGSRAFCAGTLGLGPQLETGEKNGDVGLL